MSTFSRLESSLLTNKSVDLKSIQMDKCRLCNMQPGIYPLNSDKTVLKAITDYMEINVNDETSIVLPKNMCKTCNYTINRFLTYKQYVVNVDQSLREALIKKAAEAVKLAEEITVKTETPKRNKRKLRKRTETCDSENSVSNPVEDDPVSLSDTNTEEPLAPVVIEAKVQCLLHLCVTCGKSFKTKNSLTCHEKIHLAVKPYWCEPCNTGFSVRSNLRTHEKKHHEGIRFYCSQCPRALISKCSLDRHERTHTGIKEFKCSSCSAAFYTRKELNKHGRYHTGMRPNKCDVCFKTFFERHHLTIHRRVHTGERPYICQVEDCGKSFMESQKLKRHHNQVHSLHAK